MTGPFRCAVVPARDVIIMRSERWRMEIAIDAYPFWLAFYRRMRDRKSGAYARFYAQPVEALEAIEAKVRDALK